eukprot:jgi/Psemu1/16555/gm1.16555_g
MKRCIARSPLHQQSPLTQQKTKGVHCGGEQDRVSIKKQQRRKTTKTKIFEQNIQKPTRPPRKSTDTLTKDMSVRDGVRCGVTSERQEVLKKKTPEKKRYLEEILLLDQQEETLTKDTNPIQQHIENQLKEQSKQEEDNLEPTIEQKRQASALTAVQQLRQEEEKNRYRVQRIGGRSQRINS